MINYMRNKITNIRKNFSVTFTRQFLLILAVSSLNLSSGLNFGYSAVLLPQLKLKSPFRYNYYLGSWIASISPLFMMFGALSTGAIMESIGRKLTFIVQSICLLIGWLLFLFSNHLPTMIIARVFLGFFSGSITLATITYIKEIVEPKFKGALILFSSITMLVGMTIVHILGQLLHWRTCALICAAHALVTLFILIFIKESPLWLITHDRIEEGIDIFKWLRGDDITINNEIIEAIAATKDKNNFKINMLTASSVKPILIMFGAIIASQFCGINTISFYAIDIFENSFFKPTDILTVVFVVDIVRIISTVLVKSTKILQSNSFFIFTCLTTSTLLFTLSLCFYLRPEKMIWFITVLLVVYVVFSSILVSLCFEIIKPFFPEDVHSTVFKASNVFESFCLFVSVKIMPYFWFNFDEIVLCSLSGGVTLVCTVILMFLMPLIQ